MGGPLRRESESVLSEIRELPPETLLSRYPLPVSSRLFNAEVITHEDGGTPPPPCYWNHGVRKKFPLVL